MVISKYIQRPTSIRFRVKIRNRSLLTATVSPFCCTSKTCCSTRCTMRFTTGSNIFWTSSLYCKDQSCSELAIGAPQDIRDVPLHEMETIFNVRGIIIRYTRHIHLVYPLRISGITEHKFNFFLPSSHHFVF